MEYFSKFYCISTPRINPEERVLKGSTEFVILVKRHPHQETQYKIKTRAVLDLLDSVNFNQGHNQIGNFGLSFAFKNQIEI